MNSCQIICKLDIVTLRGPVSQRVKSRWEAENTNVVFYGYLQVKHLNNMLSILEKTPCNFGPIFEYMFGAALAQVLVLAVSLRKVKTKANCTNVLIHLKLSGCTHEEVLVMFALWNL